MDEKLKYYLRETVSPEGFPEGAPEELIQSVQKQLDFRLPEEYLDAMRANNGREGEVGEDSWIVLFPIEELIEINHDYRLLMEQIPDYFLIGKDSADTGYAFHKHNHTFHAFGLMSDFRTDNIDFSLSSFSAFIEYLYNYKFDG
ncbi:MAG TPA: SMI1/KNR4 family protein [Chitinophagales bacterium]|nr:SMI1/KNR4 family protein [Chitinophagales bacterium]